ncbi:hypothetical protein NUW54_g8833 [Trametes sanguinea]|uniref:Uncharacterized protein n=1 Tax=Trametes sanguinea TaxID=158606 RepID=A0ACC1PDJ0_9APHY|nr:hypothetical protein NUW54_g8833 [Trametes sanguinea]
MDGQTSTERTPLLGHQSPPRSAQPTTDQSSDGTDATPYVGIFAAELKLDELSSFSVEELYPPNVTIQAARTAFALCVLFYYRKSIAGRQTPRGRDVWTQWRETEQHTTAIRNLDSRALQVWAKFLEDENTAYDVAEVLWTAHPVDPDSKSTVRVVDFLAAGGVPDDLQRHALIYLSLMDTWKYGRQQSRGEGGAVVTLLRFIDRCGTPRVLHIADCFAHLSYIYVLFHYIQWPPSPYGDTMRLFDTRRTLLMSYSLSRLTRPRSQATIPPLLVLLAFLVCLPYAPYWYDFSFSVLELAFYWEILLLQFAVPFSPWLFLHPEWLLPLAIIARRSLARLVAPLIFFLPLIIACLFMLDLAILVDPWLSLSAFSKDGLLAHNSFVAFVLLLITGSFICSLLVHPFLATFEVPTSSQWDRYTQSVGLEARQAFVNAVVWYGTPYYFPGQAVLGPVLLARTPRLILDLFGKRKAGAQGLVTVERILWRVVVGPVAFILSGFWLCNHAVRTSILVMFNIEHTAPRRFFVVPHDVAARDHSSFRELMQAPVYYRSSKTEPLPPRTRATYICATMSAKRKTVSWKALPPTKRRRTDFGHPQPDDDIPTPQAQANAPSAAALSERIIPPEHVPSLATVCSRVFAENLQRLSRKEEVWENVRWWLKHLPDPLAQKVFATLRHTCPTLLQHGLIVAYFLRGNSISLGDDLPGVTRLTIFAIGDISARNQLEELELTGFAKIADQVFATLLSKLPSLRKLNLRGCTKAGQLTAEAAAKHCPHLELLNLNYTSVSPVSLAPIMLHCKQLKVLKVAGIPNWTDATYTKLWTALHVVDGFELSNLRSLKLRQAALSDAVINPMLAICPDLERLDLSFTLVKRPVLPAGHALEKLVLTSTKISSQDLITMISPLTRLKVLALGAMGGGQGSSAAISNTSAMTLTDDTLRSLTDTLKKCEDIERVNLVGNTKLGFTGRRGPDAALAYFVRKVGRRCKHLNLAGITSLRSSDLEGLAHPDGADEGAPRLIHLNLNNTSVDDAAAPYISACADLQTLEVAGTKFTSAGLFPIIDACERLVKLDLTSCRGVRVGDRRRFFEVWEEEWKKN